MLVIHFQNQVLLFFLCADNYRWPEIPLSITTYLKALNCRLIWKATLTVTYGFLAQLAWRWYCSLLHNRAQWGMCLTFLKDKLTEHKMLLPLYPFTHVEWLFFPPLGSTNISMYYPPMDSLISTAWMRPFPSVSTRWTVIILSANSCLTAIQHSADQLPPTGTTWAMLHSIT